MNNERLSDEEYQKLEAKFKPESYSEPVVRVVNMAQAKSYLDAGVKPLDVFSTNKIVFVFSKAKTAELFNAWCKSAPKANM
jgi:hypothetical protein